MLPSILVKQKNIRDSRCVINSFTFYGNLPLAVCVKFRLRGKRNTAVWTCDYFLLGVASHVIPQFIQTWVLAVASGPFALDSVPNSITARVTLRMYSDVIQVHLIIREHLQAFFPSAYMRRWSFYDVLPV